jgi:hypothetical protein
MAGERGTTMKKLSDKELVNQAVILRDIVAENKYKAELLSRLNVADNLMCCGNCKHYTPRGDCRSKHGYAPGHYCDHWTQDGLTRKDRG